jgi:hypothetical protein
VFKLLFMLGTFLAVAMALLALRQHRLELTSESVKIHDQIQSREQSLWAQRALIAERTNPWALASGLRAAGVDTGAALTSHASASAPGATNTPPAIETDLAAPVRGDTGGGHANADHPR